MPRAVAFHLREEIVRRKERDGMPLQAVADLMRLPFYTVRQIWRRYRRGGRTGLADRYDRCGPRGPRSDAMLYEGAVALKREHRRWGAGVIRLGLAHQYRSVRLPSECTLQRWFRAEGLQPVRARKPRQKRERAHAAHEIWQMDAKEQIRTGGGEGCSTLDMVDEASGAVLCGAVFPPVALELRCPGSGKGGVAGGVLPVGHA